MTMVFLVFPHAGEQEYCDRLEYVLGHAHLIGSSAGVKLLCTGPRFQRDWSYLPHDWVSYDALSRFPEDVRLDWKKMNENGCYLDYHNK